MLYNLKQIARGNILEYYFCFFSRIYLKRWRPEIIVITGSVGKTSLLNLLKLQFQTSALYSHKANTKMGITCHVLNMPIPTKNKPHLWLILALITPFKALFKKAHKQKYYLVEYDVFDKYSARSFKWWLKPQVTIWLSSTQAHLENFDKLALKKKQSAYELSLNDFAKISLSATKCIFSIDNPTIRKYLKKSPIPVNYIQANLNHYLVEAFKTEFNFDKYKFTFNQPMPIEIKDNLMIMMVICDYYKIKTDTDLTSFNHPPGRSTTLKAYKDSLLIDSTYNAQLKAMESMLNMFKILKTNKNKWLILGDMIEQGSWTEKAHQDLAQHILNLKEVDKVFLIGRRIKKYTCPILEREKYNFHWILKIDIDYIKFLKSKMTGNEIILLKGAGYLDMLVEALLKDESDSKFLNKPGRLKQKLGVINEK